MELKHEPHVAVPEPHARLVVHRADVGVADAHRAGIERVESAEHVQQRALADAGRADDRDHLAGSTVSSRSAQHRQRARRVAIGLDEAA